MADEVVAHAFSHGFHADHLHRLAAYWAEALGGPATYWQSLRNETIVVKMHIGNGEHEERNLRAIACFGQSLIDIGFSGDGVLLQVLRGDPRFSHGGIEFLKRGDGRWYNLN